MANRPDGSVEAMIEGSGSAVEALIEWMRAGPSAARVDRLCVETVDDRGERFSGFEIR